MAQYHIKAEKLKPLVEAENFSVSQLNVIVKMMRGCTQLRQGRVIDSFFEAMLPDEFNTITKTIERDDGRKFQVVEVEN